MSILAFYSDGGVDGNSRRYFIHRVFTKSRHLYSTDTILDPLKNPVHIKGYAGRQTKFDSKIRYVDEFKFDIGGKPLVVVPIERFIVDKTELEKYKIISSINVYKKVTNYTCICNYFMIFVSDRKISCNNNKMLDAFTGINSIDKFEKLNLKIAKKTGPDEENTLLSNETQSYEIDLSS